MQKEVRFSQLLTFILYVVLYYVDCSDYGDILMSTVTLCASCKEELTSTIHQCKTNSVATGTITYQDQFFGLLQKVTRIHEVPPRRSRACRVSVWHEWQGPQKKWLLVIAMALLCRYERVIVQVQDGQDKHLVFFDWKHGLSRLPASWKWERYHPPPREALQLILVGFLLVNHFY